MLWGLFSKKRVESSFSTFAVSANTTRTRTIEDVGTGLLWFLNKSEQSLEHNTTIFDGDDLSVESRSIRYKAGFLGFNKYYYRQMELDGTTTALSGPITEYSSTSRPSSAAFDGMPYDGDYGSLDLDDLLEDQDFSGAFSRSNTWTIDSSARSKARSAAAAGELSFSTEDLPIPVDDDTFVSFAVDATYNPDTKALRLSIKDERGVGFLELSGNVVVGALEGSVDFNGSTYLVQIPLSEGGELYREAGSNIEQEF